MNSYLRLALAGAALASALTLPARAEDLSDFTLKLRAGGVSGSITKQSLGRRATGFGLEWARPVGRGRFSAELTYENFNGYRRETTAFGPAFYTANQDPSAPSTVTGTYTPAGSTKAYALLVRPEDSLQGESEVFRGFGLRFGWSATLPFRWTQGWNWQAGVTLDRRETHHEVFMTLVPGYYDDHHDFQVIPPKGYGDPSYYEGANYAKNFTKLLPGAYVGVSRSFGDIFQVEMNLRHSGFNDVRYRPFTTTGVAPRYEEKTRSGFVVELALGVKI